MRLPWVSGDRDGYRGCPLSAGPAALFAAGLAAGLVAGTASCTAVQGGLLAGLTSRDLPARSRRHRETRECDGTDETDGANEHRGTDETDGTDGTDEHCGNGGDGKGGGAEAGPSGPVVVALFLAGRLGSHVVAGALLGLAGSAVLLGPQVRAALLVAAGIAVVGFGIRMFGRGPRTGCHPGVAAGGRTSRRGGVSGITGLAGLAGITVPAPRALALGAATILLPCGVTLGIETVAVSSGSVLGGGAVMAGFVAGTTPAFALLGLVLRRAATTRLAALAGVAALATGLWTISSGLSLGGWLPGSGGPAMAAGAPAGTARNPMAGATDEAGAADGPAGGIPDGPAGTTGDHARAAVRSGGVQRIDIWATDRGYRPGVVTARAGFPTELVFHLVGAPGCTRTLTIDGRDVTLPATVRLGARDAGSLRYVCSMGMYVGFIRFV
ncbi:sulfite exporter TauE/SafE family protein [Streptosporangium sp. NPDC049078]|uniref:sulfite exporter TauE/SafE family protein n=1 Tax=Streptosporangium sp. NPDC049078 TaxID=3155767 RepID=UPI003445D016